MKEIKHRLLNACNKIRQSSLKQKTPGIISVRDLETNTILFLNEGVNIDSASEQDILSISLDGDLLSEKTDKIDCRIYTHIYLYRSYPYIQSICQLETYYLSLFASCRESIPPVSAHHARYFFGEVPCTKLIDGCYEEKDYYRCVGQAIIKAIGSKVVSHVQACVIAAFGGITWGTSVESAVDNFVALEAIAQHTWECGLRMKTQWKYISYDLLKLLFFSNHPEIDFYEKTQYIPQELPVEIIP